MTSIVDDEPERGKSWRGAVAVWSTSRDFKLKAMSTTADDNVAIFRSLEAVLPSSITDCDLFEVFKFANSSQPLGECVVITIQSVWRRHAEMAPEKQAARPPSRRKCLFKLCLFRSLTPTHGRSYHCRSTFCAMLQARSQLTHGEPRRRRWRSVSRNNRFIELHAVKRRPVAPARTIQFPLVNSVKRLLSCSQLQIW